MIDDNGTDDSPDAGGSRARAIEVALTRHLDVTAAILLSIATIITAWSGYQASGWSGVQARAFAEASSNRIESNREYSRAMQLVAIDTDLFLAWVAAYQANDMDLLAFYENNLMRPSFLPYLNEWRDSNPLESPDALPNPLIGEAYQQQMLAESARLRDNAEEQFTKATAANQTSDKYVLTTVFSASVLFFAGISTKFQSSRIQLGLVGMAIVTFVLGVVQVGSFPHF